MTAIKLNYFVKLLNCTNNPSKILFEEPFGILTLTFRCNPSFDNQLSVKSISFYLQFLVTGPAPDKHEILVRDTTVTLPLTNIVKHSQAGKRGQARSSTAGQSDLSERPNSSVD